MSTSVFQKILNGLYNSFKKDSARMLIYTGAAGWTLSSLAQICGILFNPEISNEQKSFLVPQELADAAVNIISFICITQVVRTITSKLFSTGKFAPESVRKYLQEHGLSKKVGKLNFDIDKVIEADKLFPAESYYATKNLGTTLATVGAGIISSNIITPIVRNSMASNVQKNYIARKKAVGDNKKVLDETNATKQPTFKSNPYYNYSSSYGLKI